MSNKVLRSSGHFSNGAFERAVLLVSALRVLTVSDGSARTGEGCNPQPRVHAVLSDGHGKIPWGMDHVARALAVELRRVDIEMVASTEDRPGPGLPVIFVNILPHQPADWGLSTKAMGAVRRDEAGSSPVFIFYPSVERVLGVPPDATRISDPEIPPAKWILGLARIIAHEILHVLLPGRPHDRTGIFASDLRVGNLIAQEFVLEDDTRAALAERLCVRPRVP